MKKYIYSLLVILLVSTQTWAQSLRQTIYLNEHEYKIFNYTTEDEKVSITTYQIQDQSNNIIEHIARKYDKVLDKEIRLGIYRTNENEIHFLEFNQSSTPGTMDYYIYAPDEQGNLVLVKNENDLKDYPKSLPPKFKNNTAPHPEYPGGSAALQEWIDQNIKTILLPHLDKDVIIRLEINQEGQAQISNIYKLNLDLETEEVIQNKIKEMPLWETEVQGHSVTGIVNIPISID